MRRCERVPAWIVRRRHFYLRLRLRSNAPGDISPPLFMMMMTMMTMMMIICRRIVKTKNILHMSQTMMMMHLVTPPASPQGTFASPPKISWSLDRRMEDPGPEKFSFNNDICQLGKCSKTRVTGIIRKGGVSPLSANLFPLPFPSAMGGWEVGTP